MSEEELRCRTCLNTRGWHELNNPIHPFNNGEAGATAFLKRRDRKPESSAPQGAETRRMAMPFDPVLRQALIDAGVITPQDLTNAEDKIRAVTAGVLGGGQWSAQEGGSTASSTETGRTSTEP